jgi:hypothetical protein
MRRRDVEFFFLSFTSLGKTSGPGANFTTAAANRTGVGTPGLEAPNAITTPNEKTKVPNAGCPCKPGYYEDR